MVVRQDVAQLAPLEMVEMFVFDPSVIGQPAGNILRWHPGTTVSGTAIIWQGKEYQPMPIEATDFEYSSAGTLPRPKVRISNIGGTTGAYVRTMQDALGARVTRKRTLGKYLDAVNFPGGNPNANPNTGYPDEIFYVARKSVENPIFVEFELALPFDVAGVQLPRRQVIAATCQWVYRSAECSYAGRAVQDIAGNATSDPKQDACRKTLDACKARFGQTGVLRHSGFPASLLARYV
jgi:lambda family phage minor tail protein L